MATKIKTQDIGDMIGADKISVRNGVFKAKWFYFYRHGNTVETFLQK